MLITAELKDKILNEFIEMGNAKLQENIYEISQKYAVNPTIMMMIFDHFEKLGFFTQEKLTGGIIDFSMKLPAFDFHAHGGFKAQEELLQNNMERLLLEIESLKPSLPDKVSTITTIVTNITTALGLIIR